MSDTGAQPHYPAQASIEAYGKGGFRFAGMSHRGSLLCLPQGIWSWAVAAPTDLSEQVLAPLLAQATELDLALIGTGRDPWAMPPELRQRFRDVGLTVETTPTGAAVRTYNVLFAEGRRVAAGLIAVD